MNQAHECTKLPGPFHGIHHVFIKPNAVAVHIRAELKGTSFHNITHTDPLLFTTAFNLVTSVPQSNAPQV